MCYNISMVFKLKFFLKMLIIVLIIVVIYSLSWLISFDNDKQFRYGVTFSQTYSEYLGLDWKEVLTATLDDLQVQNYRLVAYWDRIEIGPGIYDFKDLDWQLNEVEKRGGNVVLAVGLRAPRWPECHIPSWAKNLTPEQINEANKIYLDNVINRYVNNKTIISWQVENEPFLEIFGECQKQTVEQVEQKVKAVKKISDKKIAITDSGELSTWLPTIKIADDLGVSLYRRVRQPIVGYFNYPLPPIFYSLRARLLNKFYPNKNIYISELQLEPWINKGIIEATFSEQKKAMSEKHVSDSINFARKTGMDPIYFWGVEWWYWMKLKGFPEYWETVKSHLEVNAEKI